jgi:hypothetical protein
MEVAVGLAAMMLKPCACSDDSKGARIALTDTMLEAHLGQNRNRDLFRCELIYLD